MSGTRLALANFRPVYVLFLWMPSRPRATVCQRSRTVKFCCDAAFTLTLLLGNSSGYRGRFAPLFLAQTRNATLLQHASWVGRSHCLRALHHDPDKPQALISALHQPARQLVCAGRPADLVVSVKEEDAAARRGADRLAALQAAAAPAAAPARACDCQSNTRSAPIMPALPQFGLLHRIRFIACALPPVRSSGSRTHAHRVDQS